MLSKTKAYTYWLSLYRNYPKPERFGIGERIDAIFLEVIESIGSMRFSKAKEKLRNIEKSIYRIDRLKLFSEISWENKLITAKQYGELLETLESVGRELGGWKKTLTKTSAFIAEEKE